MNSNSSLSFSSSLPSPACRSIRQLEYPRPEELLKRYRTTFSIAMAMVYRWPGMGIAIVRQGHPVVEVGDPRMLAYCRAFSEMASMAATRNERSACEFGFPVIAKALSRPIVGGGYAIICGPKGHQAMRAIVRNRCKCLMIFSRCEP